MESGTTRERIPRARTLQDRVICGLRESWYQTYEPLRLRFERACYDQVYRDVREPLISVYIPTYNRADILLSRAVPSVLAQTYQNFELIIVGDCCSDDTSSKVKSIQDQRIRFVNLSSRKNRYPDEVELHWLAGPVVPANAALELVRGRWIARIDDDDYWTPDHLEKLLRFASEGRYEFVSSMCEFERYQQVEVHQGTHAVDPYFIPGVTTDPFSPKLGATQTWLYRSYLRFMRYNIDCWRKSWNRVNDLDLSVRIYRAGARIGFLEEVTAMVLPREGERTIGIDAYKEGAEELGKHFRFVG
jgi:glycosyltransferase involved in cell wall biosynthesis